MAATTHLNQSLVASGCAAPAAARWSATDATSVDRNRHHLTVIAPMPATYEVKPSFQGITRRPTEGSS